MLRFKIVVDMVDVVVLKVNDLGARMNSLTEKLEGYKNDLDSNRLEEGYDKVDEVVQQKAKAVLAKLNYQEKTITELRDENNNLKIVVSIMENNNAILKRKLERLEVTWNGIDEERRRKEKSMKRFKITDGRFVRID